VSIWYDINEIDALPKTTWAPSSHEVTTVVMKNCEPLVFLPALAIESKPGLVCLSWKFSSKTHALALSDGSDKIWTRTSELLAVDRLATSAVALGEVTTLEHELGDHTVEAWASVAVAVLASAELAEVPGRLGHDIIVELEDDAAGVFLADGDVEL
jgi:hypothetical protein